MAYSVCFVDVCVAKIYNAQDYLTRVGTTHSGFGPSTGVINQENTPHRHAHRAILEAVPH